MLKDLHLVIHAMAVTSFYRVQWNKVEVKIYCDLSADCGTCDKRSDFVCPPSKEVKYLDEMWFTNYDIAYRFAQEKGDGFLVTFQFCESQIDKVMKDNKYKVVDFVVVDQNNQPVKMKGCWQ